jgi:GNAT superfamily N-acetyltransferase
VTVAGGYEPAVRTATGGDLDELTRLARRALDGLADGRGGVPYLATEARGEPLRDSLAADVTAGDRLVLVGALGPVVVAYAVTAVGATRARDRAVVTDLYVEPEAREVGLGRRLMEASVDWARDRGCGGIDSVALPGDRATKNFIEGFGLVARLITVHRDLDADA